ASCRNADGGGAPVTLFDMELKDGTTDLGVLKPARGSTVRVRFPPTPGQAPQRLIVRIVRMDGIKYTRSAASIEGEAAVSGLGPGRFEMTVAPPGSTRWSEPRTIDVDGEHDLVFDWTAK